mmetsp:Transcript_90454/g.281168  ORF Transcript_90454/g.281168 Transcript_90454/m.281168 type:complete len:397 (+) Transcript_90454:74-1264(+)
MAPLAALLDATAGRSADLDAESSAMGAELAALDREIAERREEKTIAAQSAVKELLKTKEVLQKKARSLGTAAGHVRLALAKLQKAQAVGLQDWKEFREEKLALSAFALAQLQDAAVMARLKAACGGGMVTVEGNTLAFAGGCKVVPAVKKALELVESSYSASVEVEAETLRFLESRGELRRIAEKHSVSISVEEGHVHVTGVVEGARSAEKAVKWLLTGKASLACPRELIGAAKAQAKELEAETGALLEVLRSGAGGGVVCIRGDVDCVREAEEQMRVWLDDREGAYSVFVEAAEALERLGPQKLEELRGDLAHFGSKFGIAALPVGGRLELRGPAGGGWEAPARAELRQILDFYAPAPAAQGPRGPQEPEQPAQAEPEDAWGAAPEADFELGHRW